MDIEIRKYEDLTLDELYAIVEARIEVFIVGQIGAYQDLDFKDLKSYHVFWKRGKEVVAYLRIVPKGISYDKISFGRVLVKEAYRGKQLGRELVETAIEFIEDELNETEIFIGAQKYLENFYESCGFKTVSESYDILGIEHVDMIKIRNKA
ncbi:MAG: GNAT family N-acetyltransferase [Sebaldella sp.]|nr:GNAT family N-acetyltransferase [Sebaldella sp.]